MSTRLERAARDYAIAVLSAPGRPNAWVAASAVERATVHGPVYSAWIRNIDTDALGDLVHVVSPRILRARVALFLRLVRRCEAWERIGSKRLHWSTFERIGPRGIGYWVSSEHPAVPWKPLWTSATQHDPSTTPAQRRASRRGAERLCR